MKRNWLLCGFFLIVSLFIFAVALAQQPPGQPEPITAFLIESEIGRALPRQILYDPNYERYAIVDAYGRLMLVDALSFATQTILYEIGEYNGLAFSHNGRWLALAIGNRIELWDANTGARIADLADLGDALRVIGPLVFSRDDNLLQFTSIHPAPRDIRIHEYDTVTVPWLWNLTAARNEGLSTFPGQVEAWQFQDYRNGFFIGPDDRIVAALPGRLQVLDAYSLTHLFDIPTDRYERDPMRVWFSARDNQIYVRPVYQDSLIQVDTQRGVLVEIPMNVWLTPTDLERLGRLELSPQARVIGEPATVSTNSLLLRLLGEDYNQFYIDETYEIHRLTVTLIDLIIPPADTGNNVAALLLVYDEDEEHGYFILSSNAQQLILSPDATRLLARVREDEETVITYDLSAGEEINRFIPALRAIGRYERVRQNRVLAYAENGAVIVSDFQRYSADTAEVLANDLRYSRRFDRFFFSSDSQSVVTLSGSEWRVWNVATGEVLRREVLDFADGTIMSTSSDGYHFLLRTWDGIRVIDLAANTQEDVTIDELPGRDIEQIIPNSTWEDFLVVYAINPWGQYDPGNEIALYNLHAGQQWFIAGDDLPPIDNRSYGWVDDATVYVSGEGAPDEQPSRIFGVEYHPSGLPACLVAAYPDAPAAWNDLWEWLVLYLRPDALANLSQLICADLPDTLEEVQQMLLPTATLPPMSPTPITLPGVPVCLTARYPAEADLYAAIWRNLTQTTISAEEQIRLAELLCEGIEDDQYNWLGDSSGNYGRLTMMIDAQTGLRAGGAFTPVERVSRPMEPIYDLFEQTTGRQLGTAVLSPNGERIASSNLPGELVVYRMLVSYQSLLDQVTATAQADLLARNLIAALPTSSPTYYEIGTPRPTLTPTVTPTPIPRPQERVDQSQWGESVDLCPSEQLYTLGNLPADYQPTGRLIAPNAEGALWAVEPEDGRRYPDETIPVCCSWCSCDFSPDQQWLLVDTYTQIYILRPDGTDRQILFDEGATRPETIWWSGPNTLEYEVDVWVEEGGREARYTALQRDILDVDPDPAPWIPRITINNIRANIISLQPGGSWLLVRTTFSTGFGPGYKYYLYDLTTGNYRYFARLALYPDQELETFWHPLGDRLFYNYPLDYRSDYEAEGELGWYQINIADGSNRFLGNLPGGVWSNEGRYRVFATDRRAQPISVWDSLTGLTRTYCIPETGARFYEGYFTWSPDSRYIALQAPLPHDEADPNVGQHTLILDIETGAVVDLIHGDADYLYWAREPGTYGEGN